MLVEGLRLKSVNKWFINYRYNIFIINYYYKKVDHEIKQSDWLRAVVIM